MDDLKVQKLPLTLGAGDFVLMMLNYDKILNL